MEILASQSRKSLCKKQPQRIYGQWIASNLGNKEHDQVHSPQILLDQTPQDQENTWDFCELCLRSKIPTKIIGSSVVTIIIDQEKIN